MSDLTPIPLRDDLFDDVAAAELALLMKALADPHRLYILALLTDQAEMTVSDITANMDLSQPTVSHHLRVLIEAGLLTRRRARQPHADGLWSYHALVPGRLAELSNAIAPARRQRRPR